VSLGVCLARLVGSLGWISRGIKVSHA
jgi:hypothetical protein